jgi:hypothetical protein
LQLLCGSFQRLISLYPKAYREEYSDELQIVFNLSIEEAARLGKIETAKAFLREIITLPAAILYEHLRERRKAKMIKNLNSQLNFSPGSRSEFMAAFTPFFVISILLYAIPLFIPYTPEEMPAWGEAILVFSRLSLLGFIFILLMLGFGKGLPRWFLPFLGFIFSIVSIFAFNALLDPNWHVFSFLFRASEFLQNFAYQGLLLMGILPLVILLVLSAMLIPKFRPFYSRVRQDWTLLSFLIYGTAPFAILLTFDAYENSSSLYQLGSLFILAMGGWFYLHSEAFWKKFLFLYIGMVLSLAVAAMGRAILCENGLFDEWVFDCTWQIEVMDTITWWVWLAIFMLLPLAINLLPRFNVQAFTIDGNEG